MAGMEEIEAYHVSITMLERFERLTAELDDEARESEDFKEIWLTCWLVTHQRSLGCPF